MLRVACMCFVDPILCVFVSLYINCQIFGSGAFFTLNLATETLALTKMCRCLFEESLMTTISSCHPSHLGAYFSIVLL